MATQLKTVLVTGATGQQGGAVARSLLRQGHKVRALTRSPNRAVGLAKAGAEIVKGDLTEKATCERALQGTDGVFAVSTFIEAGMDGEVRWEARTATPASRILIPNGKQNSTLASLASRPRFFARCGSWRISVHTFFLPPKES